jgi:hypothetical protein
LELAFSGFSKLNKPNFAYNCVSGYFLALVRLLLTLVRSLGLQQYSSTDQICDKGKLMNIEYSKVLRQETLSKHAFIRAAFERKMDVLGLFCLSASKLFILFVKLGM